MKRFLGILWLMAAVVPLATAGSARLTTSFDNDWRFSTSVTGTPEQPAFDDSTWRKLNVPHDWSIAGPFAATNETGCAGGYLPAGVGWYRKHFTLPERARSRRLFIQFDGVMANSDVWINGTPLGHRPSGYVGFAYELTGHLNLGGADNELVVKADNSRQPASRWYEGAGIYRHVRLLSLAPIHLLENGVFITTPEVKPGLARVHIESAMTNASSETRKITLRSRVYAPDGAQVAEINTPLVVTNGTAALLEQEVRLTHPQLWNLDSPQLYQVVSEVRAGWETLDDQTTTIGLREATFEPDTGFWLNGQNMKLKGVCLHQDGGAFGVAVPISVWADRLTTLKALGVNAIRTAHNPPAPEFLDLCDRLGLVVMDELFDCWMVGKNSLDGAKLQDYHLYFADWSLIDERDTVRRDRNHPSIIVYSAGNEIHDTPDPERAKKILGQLVAVFHENDPSRPVTQALFRPNVSGDYHNGLADMLDVVGQNYRENEILAAHQQTTTRKILGTENRHDRTTWLALRDHAPYAGQFLWTGIDYLGETTRWPEIGHGSGLLDRTGLVRPLAYERQSWWSDRPMVQLGRRLAPNDRMPTDPGYGGAERHTQVVFADWTPTSTNATEQTVEAYSNCQDVELFLNGHSLGSQPLPADASPRVWRVPFEPGTLRAEAKNGAAIVATSELKTAGAPDHIELRTDGARLTPAGDDVAVVRATVVDAHGVRVPTANQDITFDVAGAGWVAATDNGDNTAHDAFSTPHRPAYGGQCVAFVKATASGNLVITATAPGLQQGWLTIKAQP